MCTVRRTTVRFVLSEYDSEQNFKCSLSLVKYEKVAILVFEISSR